MIGPQQQFLEAVARGQASHTNGSNVISSPNGMNNGSNSNSTVNGSNSMINGSNSNSILNGSTAINSFNAMNNGSDAIDNGSNSISSEQLSEAEAQQADEEAEEAAIRAAQVYHPECIYQYILIRKSISLQNSQLTLSYYYVNGSNAMNGSNSTRNGSNAAREQLPEAGTQRVEA